MNADNASARAMGLVDQMERDLRDWLRTPTGEVATDSPETLDAAVDGFKAGWFAGLAVTP